jgi:ferritin
MSEKMANAINEQINAEFYSAFLYLSMATQLEEMNLPGFANWMRVQKEEEEFHAMKFFDYLVSRQSRVALKEIAAPPVEWESPLEIFEAAYKHEQHVTALINGLVKIAMEEGDFASLQMLQWFVEEQVEEEDNTSTIRDKIEMVQDAPGGMYMLDQEMAVRVFTPPTTGAP